MGRAGKRVLDPCGSGDRMGPTMDEQVEGYVFGGRRGLDEYPVRVVRIRSGTAVEVQAPEMSLDCRRLKRPNPSIGLTSTSYALGGPTPVIEHLRNVGNLARPLANPEHELKVLNRIEGWIEPTRAESEAPPHGQEVPDIHNAAE